MTRTAEEVDVTELALTMSLLLRRIRSTAPADVKGLSWTQKAVIVRLDEEGPATTAELARAEGVTPQSMGTAIAELEKLEFVARRPHPTDGRQQNIEITPRGSAARKRARDAKLSWLAEAVAGLDARDQATLLAAGRIIKRLVEQ